MKVKNEFNAKTISNTIRRIKDEGGLYSIRWRDLYHKTVDTYEITAQSEKDALKALAKTIALAGIGTYNCYVMSVNCRKDSTGISYPRLYGRLSDLITEYHLLDEEPDDIHDSHSFSYRGIEIIQTSYGYTFIFKNKRYQAETDTEASDLIDKLLDNPKSTDDSEVKDGEYSTKIKNAIKRGKLTGRFYTGRYAFTAKASDFEQIKKELKEAGYKDILCQNNPYVSYNVFFSDNSEVKDSRVWIEVPDESDSKAGYQWDVNAAKKMASQYGVRFVLKGKVSAGPNKGDNEAYFEGSKDQIKKIAKKIFSDYDDEELEEIIEDSIIADSEVDDALIIPKTKYSLYNIPANASNAFYGRYAEFEGEIYYQIGNDFYCIGRNGKTIKTDEKMYWHARSDGKRWSKDSVKDGEYSTKIRNAVQRGKITNSPYRGAYGLTIKKSEFEQVKKELQAAGYTDIMFQSNPYHAYNVFFSDDDKKSEEIIEDDNDIIKQLELVMKEMTDCAEEVRKLKAKYGTLRDRFNTLRVSAVAAMKNEPQIIPRLKEIVHEKQKIDAVVFDACVKDSEVEDDYEVVCPGQSINGKYLYGTYSSLEEARRNAINAAIHHGGYRYEVRNKNDDSLIKSIVASWRGNDATVNENGRKFVVHVDELRNFEYKG